MIFGLGAILGLISVAFGAYAEHGLRAQLSDEVFRFVMTAIRYNQVHAVIITAIGLAGLSVNFSENHKLVGYAGYALILGTLLFSFSIYLSAVLGRPELTKITPFGGITLMIGWLMLAIAGFTSAAHAKEKTEQTMTNQPAKNILGTELASCCTDPMTGFLRDGYCHTNAQDVGTHVVCAVVTDEFLEFTHARGNDLSTPRPEYDFPGLKAGDGWCLCALRWKEAYEAGVAPPVKLESTHAKALDYIPLETLKSHAIQ